MSAVDRRGFFKRAAVGGVTALALQRALEQGKEPVMAAGEELFQAGVAVRDITPAPGLPLWGYTDVERPASGTRDPLYAKAIVFRGGGNTAALVSLDLGRPPVRERVEAIRAKAKAMGIDHVSLVASHTHSAPYMELPGLPHLDAIDEAIVAALEEALKACVPARIGVGRCDIAISHNRRVIKNGECYMLWRNAKRLPTAPLDTEAGVIRIDGPGGKPLATLVNFACHPVIFGPDNTRYSADWVGAMCAKVEQATKVPCLFLQGACGDINPNMDKTPLDQDADKVVDEEGATAARAVIACHKGTEAIPPKSPSVLFHEERVAVGTRYDMTDPGQERILREVYGPMYDVYMLPFAADPTVPVTTLLLNGDLGFVFLAGEPFIRYQADLKRDSPLRDAFLCGYANEFHAYFPSTGAAIIGGYGASSVTYVGLGAGDRMMTAGKIGLGTLMGRVRPLIGASDLTPVDLDETSQKPSEWGSYWGPIFYKPPVFD